MTTAQKDIEQAFSLTLIGAVEKTFLALLGKKLVTDPKVQAKPIITWQNRMRVFSYEKFFVPHFISIFRLYLNEETKKKDSPYACVIFYIEKARILPLLSLFGVEVQAKNPSDEHAMPPHEDESILSRCCAQAWKKFTEALKKELVKVGYPDLVMAEPLYYHTAVPNDINYPVKIEQKYELYFKLEGCSFIYIDFVIPVK